MKALMAKDTLIAYPDHNKEFKIETDASDCQLGGRIFQEHEDEDDPAKLVNRDVAFYSRKLSSAQKNYTTIEKEMLSVVEVLKEYRPMLLGAKITIYTDHCNLTYKLRSMQLSASYAGGYYLKSLELSLCTSLEKRTLSPTLCLVCPLHGWKGRVIMRCFQKLYRCSRIKS